MRLQQLLFASFASSVLLIGCSKPVDAKTIFKPQIVDVNPNTNIKILEIVNRLITIFHTDSYLSVNHMLDLNFGFSPLQINHSKKGVQLFHKEEEIKINGEFKILNRYV